MLLNLPDSHYVHLQTTTCYKPYNMIALTINFLKNSSTSVQESHNHFRYSNLYTLFILQIDKYHQVNVSCFFHKSQSLKNVHLSLRTLVNMEFFKRTNPFRLKCGHHGRYLLADEDEETIRQSSTLTSPNALWTFELIEGKPNVVRFRNRKTNKYLATTDTEFLTGMTGKKVMQRLRLDSTVEWEPIKEGQFVKLRSRTGTLLRANPRFPPWSNSVTHDKPGHWTASETMVLWIVDFVAYDFSTSGSKDVNVPPEKVKRMVDSSSTSNTQKSRVGPTPSGSINDFSNRSQNPDGERKLSRLQTGLADELLRSSEGSKSESDRGSRLPSFESWTGLAVNVSKLSFKELKGIEFHEVLSSGQFKKLERAVSVLIADEKVAGQRNINSNIANLPERLKAMTKDHDKASKDLLEYTSFSSGRHEARAELQKMVKMVRELESVEIELNDSLMAANAKREELLKQLEDVENSIKVGEKSQAGYEVEVQEIVSRIETKSKTLKVIEREHKSWVLRKSEAESTLEMVEKDWIDVKDALASFL